jgi:hypothetical protein
MRKLNAKQKKLLTQVARRMNHPTSINEIPFADYEAIYDVNPHEDFDTNADRFLFDLKAQVVYR